MLAQPAAKAKTINKYLGKDYQVLASFGHIRDLPSKDGSVLPDEDFAMTWELSPGGKKRLQDIVKAVKEADTIVLASDPDREGEAIAWHILEELKAKKLLAENELIIKEISEELGFTDAPHFVKFFKKETGMTPGQFKETL